MAERETLQTLHSVVHCYLATLQAIAEMLPEACPAVGGPHCHRLTRLRTRLSFNADKLAIEESSAAVKEELRQYGTEAAEYLQHHLAELAQTCQAIEGIARSMVQRQDLYSSRLREFAAQMEAADYPGDEQKLRDLVELQAAGLLSCAESMSHDGISQLERIREAVAEGQRRLAEAEITDAVTGLINRREMERHMARQATRTTPPVPLLFRIQCKADPAQRDEVLRQIAARLGSQCRHEDLLARWGVNEFLMLFQGREEIAQKRGGQITQWLSGRYSLPEGETVDVIAGVQVLDNQSPAGEQGPALEPPATELVED